MTPEQKANCLKLVNTLEAIPDTLYTPDITVVAAFPLGIKGNALAHAADKGIGGLGLYWPTPKRAHVLKDRAILMDQSILESIFGPGIPYDMFSLKTRRDVIVSISAFAGLSLRTHVPI